MERFVTPTVDIPDMKTDDRKYPTWIVSTNRGDPLYDEGYDFVKELQAKSNKVKYFDHGGSHHFGTALDGSAYDDLVSVWRAVVLDGACCE